MADSNELEKDTVRITVSPQPSSPPSASAESCDTVRIHLPTRPPANPPSEPVDSPSPARSAAAAMPAPMTMPAPKKETARITVLPNRRAKPVVEMKKTQPLIDLPAPEKPAASVKVTSEPEEQVRIDNIPIWLCWALLAASVTILILQIWNYFS